MTPRVKPDPFEEYVRKVASGSKPPAGSDEKLRDALSGAVEAPSEAPAAPVPDAPVQPASAPALPPAGLMPEIILGGGLSPVEALALFKAQLERSGGAFAARLGSDAFELLRKEYPDCRFSMDCMAVSAGPTATSSADSRSVAVITSGRSDMKAAAEAEFLLEECGVPCHMFVDFGYTGIQRLASSMQEIGAAAVCLVFAGMDGGLPSILGGFYGGPVIAVPTSGDSRPPFGGIAPLMSMLASGTPGISVVGIDNGLGAAAAALRILGRRGGASS